MLRLAMCVSGEGFVVVWYSFVDVFLKAFGDKDCDWPWRYLDMLDEPKPLAEMHSLT